MINWLERNDMVLLFNIVNIDLILHPMACDKRGSFVLTFDTIDINFYGWTSRNCRLHIT